MGAAAVCPKCGQGPMSKTHYYYKGGWQCKKGAVAPPAPQAVPASATSPAQTVVAQSRVAPAAAAAPAPMSPKPMQGLPKAPSQQSMTPGQFPAATQRKMLEQFLGRLSIKNYSINPDLSVDVDGDVKVTTSPYTRIPCKFKNVSGAFIWSAGKLLSLENAPDEVGGDFDVHGNQLKTLDGMPQTIGGMISLSGNQLQSWKGLPATTKDDLFAHGNPATDIVENLPSEIGGSLTIGATQPWSLRGIHKKTRISGDVTLTGQLAEGGLGLMMLKGMTFIDASNMTDKNAEKAFEMISKARENKDDVLDTQERLIDAGLSKYAKL